MGHEGKEDQISEFATVPQRISRGIVIDWVFFVFAGLAAVWLAILGFSQLFDYGWWGILLAVLYWGLLAYLVLPRLHRILTSIYVPDYFIGRTRTSDGLLGDPVNLALMGSEAEIVAAMKQAGWIMADPVTAASSWRIITSTLRGRSYAEAPVSPLFLFGRQQAFAFQQEVDGNPKQRHHIRFWPCPDGWLLPGGRRVDWLAAGTFDTSVGLSLFTLQVTHRIDANTDVERNYVIRTVLDHVPTASLDVIEDFSTGYHARNGGGDSIHTDGDLPILDLSEQPHPPKEQMQTERRRVALVDRLNEVQAAPEKRIAYEAVPALLQPTERDPAMPRPMMTVAGTVLILIRALAGFLIVVGLVRGWDELLSTVDSAVELLGMVFGDPQQVAVLVLVIGITLLCFQVLLAALVFRGSNWPRVLIMAIAAIDIATTFIAWSTGGPQITVEGMIFSLAIDILILLALSDRNAAAYARRR